MSAFHYLYSYIVRVVLFSADEEVPVTSLLPQPIRLEKSLSYLSMLKFVGSGKQIGLRIWLYSTGAIFKSAISK